MVDVLMDGFSDRGSTPLISIVDFLGIKVVEMEKALP